MSINLKNAKSIALKKMVMVNRSAMSPPYLHADIMHVTRLQPVLMSKSATGEWSAPPLTRFNRDEMHFRASDENRFVPIASRVTGLRVKWVQGLLPSGEANLQALGCSPSPAREICRPSGEPASGVHTRLALDPPPSLVVPRSTSPR